MRKFLSLLTTVILSIPMLAQNDMTPYEKGRKDLADEALSKMFDVFSERDQLSFGASFLYAIENTNDIYEQVAIAENFISGLCGVGEMYKTEANYMAESIWASIAYTGNTLQNLKSIGDWYKTQRAELEKTKTANDINREKERVQQSRSIGLVYKNINKRFTAWAQKGELEKTSAYQQRLRRQAISAFDSLCFICSSEAIRQNVQFVKKGYNADDEVYNIQWNIIDAERNVLSHQDGSFPLPPGEVQDFKRTDYISWSDTYAFGIGLHDGYVFPVKAKMEFSGGFYPSITFPEIIEQPISSDIITDAELRNSLSGHVYKAANFRSRIIFRDEANAELEGLTERVAKAYSGYHSQVSYYDLRDTPFWSFPGDNGYCSKAKFNDAFNKYKKAYTDKLFESLIENSNYHLSPNIDAGQVRDAILNCDAEGLKARVKELQIQWLSTESKALTKEQLQRDISSVPFFRVLYFELRQKDPIEYCTMEEMCKVVIESNEYLSSKIKVRETYYEALKAYYDKHK